MTTIHDARVRAIAASLQQQGYSVQADLPDFNRPPLILGHIPDIFAVRLNERYLVEVETPESLLSAHTAQQTAAFRAYCRRTGIKFALAVTDGRLLS